MEIDFPGKAIRTDDGSHGVSLTGIGTIGFVSTGAPFMIQQVAATVAILRFFVCGYKQNGRGVNGLRQQTGCRHYRKP